MVAHRKTTVEIADALFERARDAAQRDGTTLRALLEEGLRTALEGRQERPAYRWPDLSVGGEGLQPGFEEGDWARARDLIYEGRGG